MLNAFTYLGCKTIREVNRMTPREYFLRMEAYQIQQANHRNDIVLQAFYNQVVQATKGSSKHPKPKYKTLDKLYDVQAEIKKIRSEFEGDKPEEVNKLTRAQIIAKRIEEYAEIRERRKANGRKL
ncbi:hypothetical protein H0240_07685 [Pediococcus pentosaceus]|nr:hypothetical protein [Pediococcus pentosaceus]